MDLFVAVVARSRTGRSSPQLGGLRALIWQCCGFRGLLATGVRDGSLASFPRNWLDERWTLAVAYRLGEHHTRHGTSHLRLPGRRSIGFSIDRRWCWQFVNGVDSRVYAFAWSRGVIFATGQRKILSVLMRANLGAASFSRRKRFGNSQCGFLASSEARWRWSIDHAASAFGGSTADLGRA